MKKGRSLQTAILLVVSVSYLSYVFQIPQGVFWKSGLGDWGDPYFINALMEHWYRAVSTVSDPSSPPMYFPVRGTLGYSHGLILYVPFYLPLRLFLHPFHAYNATVFAVMELGIVCLFVVFRRFFRLSFLESLLLSAFFFSSQNVVNGPTSIWSQRASVYLIPPILLLAVVSIRMRDGRARLALAWLSGLLATLVFTQDFYTGQFALFFVVMAAAAVALEQRPAVAERARRSWHAEHLGARVSLVSAALALAWAFYVWDFGGVAFRFAGVKIASHDWRRPLLVGLGASVLFVWLRGWRRTTACFRWPRPWVTAFSFGALAGCAVFFWIYLSSYLEHPKFPEEHLMNVYVMRDPSRWKSPLDFVRDLRSYDTLRAFELVLAGGVLAWLPWFRIDRKTRLQWLGMVAVSLLVLLVPLRFNGFSIWETVFRALPGFGPIRDPKRIIQLYELAAVLAIAHVLRAAPLKSAFRIGVVVLMTVLLVLDPNRKVFGFDRPIDVYDRWVGRPIAIVGDCRSFYITRASDAYASRFHDYLWALYSIDAIFVSLKYGIPTVNGFSAWYPEGWDLINPTEEVYMGRVKRWVERYRLKDVCEFDIEGRTMKKSEF